MKYKKRLLALILASTIAIGATACSDSEDKNQENLNTSNATTNTVQGNINVNLTNDGIVAAQEDWLFFSGKDGLYKSKTDGFQLQKLADGYKGGSVYWINVVDDWIYYRINSDTSGTIHKIKIDGSNKQILYNGPKKETTETEANKTENIKQNPGEIEQEILDQIQESLERREYEIVTSTIKEYNATSITVFVK